METTVMKTNQLNSFFRSAMLSSALVTGLFASSGAAHAQSSSILRANIPFAFQAGFEQMPAGRYEIVLISDNLMVLRNMDPGKSVAQIVQVKWSPGRTFQAQAQLVFQQYGDRYFLRAARERGTVLIEWPPSRAEREIRRSQNHRVAQTLTAVNAEPNR
jgi:hypothetical protein